VFAEEGVPLRAKGRARAWARRRPVVLFPANRDQFPLFWVCVYGRHQAEGDLGLVMVDEGHEMVRIRNVVVAFDPKGDAVGRVRTAIEQLRVQE